MKNNVFVNVSKETSSIIEKTSLIHIFPPIKKNIKNVRLHYNALKLFNQIVFLIILSSIYDFDISKFNKSIGLAFNIIKPFINITSYATKLILRNKSEEILFYMASTFYKINIKKENGNIYIDL